MQMRPLMRRFALVASACVLLGGCVNKPLPPLNAGQQNFRDQEIRLMFAKLIVNNKNFGSAGYAFAIRDYANARISIPHDEGGHGTVVCAKVIIGPSKIFPDNLLTKTREYSIHADVEETRGMTRVSMSRYEDVVGSPCREPFVPFPELEALSAPKQS